MTTVRFLSASALLALFASPASAAIPETWTVSCLGGKTWTTTTPPNQTNGAFEFTLPDGTQVRTTSGMNCWAVRNHTPTN